MLKSKLKILIPCLIIIFIYIYFFSSVYKLQNPYDTIGIEEGTLLLASKFNIYTNNYSIGDLVIFKSSEYIYDHLGIVADYKKDQSRLIIVDQYNIIEDIDRKSLIAKVMLPKIKIEKISEVLSKYYESKIAEESKSNKDSIDKNIVDSEEIKKRYKVECEEANAIYSKDKDYIACLKDDKYAVARSFPFEEGYYRFSVESGRIKVGDKEYISYADYPGEFENAYFYGTNLDKIYSRVFELNSKNKTLRVVVDPWLLPNIEEWFLKYRGPQFMLGYERSYSVSPNGRFLVVLLSDCTQCSTYPEWLVVNLDNSKMVSIGNVYEDENTFPKWVNNNTLEWNVGKIELTDEIPILKNSGKVSKSF